MDSNLLIINSYLNKKDNDLLLWLVAITEMVICICNNQVEYQSEGIICTVFKLGVKRMLASKNPKIIFMGKNITLIEKMANLNEMLNS